MATDNTGNEAEVIVRIKANDDELDAALKKVQGDVKNAVNQDVSSTTFKSFKAQIREATNELARMQQAGQDNTDEFRRAAAQLANLRDQQEDLNRTVNAFNPDNRFQGVVSLAKAGAGAIQGYTGALAFLGVESENATQTLAKLQGIMAFTDSLSSITDLKDGYKSLVNVVKSSVSAFKGAEGGAKAFGLGLKALGIGLLITAIAYLVTNFDDIKEQFKDILPAGEKVGKVFNTIKSVAMGVGNAVLQFIIAPIKAVISLIKGDFEQAMNDLKKGVDVAGNAQAGHAKSRANQAKDAAKEQAKTELDAMEHSLKLARDGSKEKLELENKAADLRIKAAATEADRKEAIQEREVLYSQRKNKALDEADRKAEEARKKADERAKAAAEKAGEARRAALDEITKNNAAALQLIQDQNENARDRELSAALKEYQTKLSLYQKYGQDAGALTEAFAVQQAEINKKYDEQINSALIAREQKNLEVFQQKEIEINKFYDDLLKNAADKEIQIIEAQRKASLAAMGVERSATDYANDTGNALTTISAQNAPNESDNAQTAYDKRLAILAAEVEAENAAFKLAKIQKANSNAELEKLQADHTAKMIGFERQRSDATKAIAKAEHDGKAALVKQGADIASLASEALGEQTAAGKAFAVAAATINTYQSATAAYAAGLAAGGPYGLVLGPIAAAAAVAAGLLNVRNILKVNVPGKGAGGGGGSLPSFTAPSASSFTAPEIAASQTEQDINAVNAEGTIVRAYVVEQDITDAQDQARFLNNLASI
jgi:hypothetical protein